jgi:DNA-binding beta-propeller fold protein YncE
VSLSRWQAGVRLGNRPRGKESRVIATTGVKSLGNGVAVSRDGSALLVSDLDCKGDSPAIHEFRVADGSRLRVVGGAGDKPLQFKSPGQVWVASDDFVFVADHGNNRVQVLTPRLDFHAFVGVGHIDRPAGVCANDTIVVVSEWGANRITVFNRGDGALLRRVGSYGSGDGQLSSPFGLCFMTGDRHVAVADHHNNRVVVFSVDGDFVRNVGVGTLAQPRGVACSAYDELVVADAGNSRAVVLGAAGELLKIMGPGEFSGVAIHGGTIFAQDKDNAKCILYK